MTHTDAPAGKDVNALVGRAMAGATFALTAYGVLTLILMGRVDHFAEGAAMFAVFAAGFGALTWLSFPRQPSNRALWVPALASLLSGLGVAGWATTLLIAERAGVDVSSPTFASVSAADVPTAAAIAWVFVLLAAGAPVALMITLWPLLFPNGRVPTPRWRWVAWGALTNIAMLNGLLLWFYRPGSEEIYRDMPEGIAGLIGETLFVSIFVWAAASFVSLVTRHRRSRGDARRQYRWVTLGTLLLLVAHLVIDNEPWALSTALVCVVLSVVSYAVAVTKHRLYDIDVFISRTIVYGTLAVSIGAVYVLVVVVVGGALGSRSGSLALALVATALVAMAFEPLRRLAQSWANQLVYGKRSTPYEVLSDLTQRLAGTEPAQGVLERMARLMAEGTGAEQATVWLTDKESRLIAAAGWPELPVPSAVDSMDDLGGALAPVTHDGEPVGVLQVVKGRGNPVTPPEQHLLDDLAGSAGLVLGNQRLNKALAARADELQQSRRRLVEMQNNERRRLERDLHDGAQQQVIALKLKIGLAEHVAKKEGRLDLADQLSDLAVEAQTAVDEIRALAKGIYPPLLESEDLVSAIKAHAAASPVPVEILASGIGRYPRDVESAAYFAALEAMTNAISHGRATHVAIDVQAAPGHLSVTVSDDGSGFDSDHTELGVGLVNIRDRIEALGGELVVNSTEDAGTTLAVTIPLDGTGTTGGTATEDQLEREILL